MSAMTLTELETAAREAGQVLEDARAEMVAAQAVADSATDAHDTLIERAYNGDDSIPWAQVKRAERDMTAAAARLDQAHAALADAERADKDSRRELHLEELTHELTEGPIGTAMRQSWSRYIGYLNSAQTSGAQLKNVPHGRRDNQTDDAWHMQQAMDQSHGAVSFEEGSRIISAVDNGLRAAVEAQSEFRAAAAAYNAKLDEATRVLRSYGLASWLIRDGRDGYRHTGRTVVRCDMSGNEVKRQDEALSVLYRARSDAALRMQHQKPAPEPLTTLRRLDRAEPERADFPAVAIS